MKKRDCRTIAQPESSSISGHTTHWHSHTHRHRHMYSQDREKGEDRCGEGQTIDWDKGREGERERGMGTQKMVPRSNYGMPGHRRQCRGTCTHTLQNTFWRPALSKHCLVWERGGERETEREGEMQKENTRKNESSRVILLHPVLYINTALNQQFGWTFLKTETLQHYWTHWNTPLLVIIKI